MERIRGKVDFIYLRSEYLVFLVWCARLIDVPYFYELHREGRSKKEASVKEMFARHARGVVVISGVLEKAFSRFNQALLVAHDAVDLSRFSGTLSQSEAREKLGIDTNETIALYSGSLTKEKGVDLVIEVARQFPDITFYLLGRGTLPSVPANIRLVGFVDNEKVPAYLAAADILLGPHRESIYAQSPMKLFEYMAVGKPIISSDLPNIREVLTDTGNLFFVAGNVEDLEKQLKTFIANKSDYKEASKKNREDVQLFTWDKRGEHIAEFITEAL